MFERYTDRARRSVILAQEEARMTGHAEVGTGHMLVALAAEGEGVAARALALLGVDASALRKAAAELAPPGTAPAGHIPFTRDLKKALELGLREAIKLGHNFIGTEHLLLGLMRACGECEGTPCGAVLRAAGTSPGPVREAVMVLLPGYGELPSAARFEPPARSVGEDRKAIGDMLGVEAAHVRHFAMVIEADEGTIIKFCCDDKLAAAQMLADGMRHVMSAPAASCPGTEEPADRRQPA